MSTNEWKSAGTKLIWIGVPLFISLMIWLVSMSYSTQEKLSNIEVKNVELSNMQEKIYDKVEANYVVLQSKVDQLENKQEHGNIIVRLDVVEKQLNKIYYYQKNLSMREIDPKYTQYLDITKN